MDFYHYMALSLSLSFFIIYNYRQCQHTFQYNQLEKMHVPLYDPFKCKVSVSINVSMNK